MNQAEVTRFKAELMAKRQEILVGSRHREDIWIVGSSDLIETVQLASDREFAVRILEREAKCLAQIDAALDRINIGEFGTCLECEEPISPKRLAAVPWAAYCLHCQESHDTREPMNSHQSLLAA